MHFITLLSDITIAKGKAKRSDIMGRPGNKKVGAAKPAKADAKSSSTNKANAKPTPTAVAGAVKKQKAAASVRKAVPKKKAADDDVEMDADDDVVPDSDEDEDEDEAEDEDEDEDVALSEEEDADLSEADEAAQTARQATMQQAVREAVQEDAEQGELKIGADPDVDPYLLKDASYIKTDLKWRNKQRTLVFASRGVSSQHRHLMDDLKRMMPHAKEEAKFEKNRSVLSDINEV